MLIERNVTYANFCTECCRFCAFRRPTGYAQRYILGRPIRCGT